MRVYVTEKHKDVAQDFASPAERQFSSCPAPSASPNPPGSISSSYPTTLSPPPGRPRSPPSPVDAVAGKTFQRLLSNTLAHQWWGSQVSPATLNDAWITNGMSRYAELMYLEDSAGKNAFQSAITDISAGALAYDTEPLTTIGRLDPFSPQFQSMTLEKGAMVFHMLRWEMGERGLHQISARHF